MITWRALLAIGLEHVRGGDVLIKVAHFILVKETYQGPKLAELI